MAKEKLAELEAPAQVYVPEIGDVLWDAKKWLLQTPPLPWEHHRHAWEVIHLQLIRPNPGSALKLLGVDVTDLKNGSMYECPYTGYQHFGIVPHSIVTKDGGQYRDKVIAAYGRKAQVLDFEWLQHFWKERYWGMEPTSIQTMLLGSGYTIGTGITDGHSKTKPGVVCLSNGDYLRVNFWERYNK